MSEALNTEPIEIDVPGPLGLQVIMHPRHCGVVHVSGSLSVGLSQSIDRALSFLPWLIRRQIKNGLMHRELNGTQFKLRIPNILTLKTDVTEDGILTLQTQYHLLLARPIGHKETTSMFQGFAKGLISSGITPFDSSPIDAFLRTFKRQDQAELPFLHLFEGKSIERLERSTFPIEGLTLKDLTLSQDQEGDLRIDFISEGRLQDYNVPTDHGCIEICCQI